MASNNVRDLASVLNFYQSQMNEENIYQSSEVEDEEQNNINESVEAQSKKVVNEGLKLLEAARQEYDDEAVVFKYDVEVFINEIEGYPALWNTSARSHHDQDIRKTSWEELSKKFNKPVEFLKSQWKNLRENLKRCLVKRSKMMKSGAAFHTLPKCKYFAQLQFLQEKVMNKETCSNVMGSPPPVELFSSPETVSDFSTVAESPASTPSRPYAKRSSSECSSSSSKSSSSSSKKIKEQTAAQMDMHVLNTLKDISEATKNISSEKVVDAEEDEDMHFCKSLVGTLRKFDSRTNKIAKLKIQQLLFELEFGESV